MTVKEIKDKLDRAFGEYQFVEQGHYYIYKENKVGISTTGLIHLYTNEFDSNTISQRVATKRGITQQEVLDEWKKENVHSTTKGNMIHEYAQSLWLGTNYEFDFSKVSGTIDLDRLKIDIEKLKPQADSFYNDFKDLYTLIGCELYLGDTDYDECGATDMLLYNNETGGIVVADFKTNKEIVYESKYNQQMLVPLQDYDDVNYIHYSLQLCNYAYKITKNTGIEIEDKIIIYFSIENDNYELIKPLDIMKEAKQILEMRRVKNMNGMGILLMGASGTGKSSSFRNLPANETAIINVTNKPMPFRNKNGLTVVNCADYEQIIKAVKATKKRIVVIDDSSYLMSFENFEKANIKGYEKFTSMAVNYYNLIEMARTCDNEKIIYIVTHEETDDVTGLARPKTIGKMLNQQLVIEGLFSVVLRSMYKNGEYIFQTQNDGTSVCKSPMGLFEEKEIPNDLAEVDKLLREYYDFKPITEKVEEPKKEKKEEEK